jgi:hypothetical protein
LQLYFSHIQSNRKERYGSGTHSNQTIVKAPVKLTGTKIGDVPRSSVPEGDIERDSRASRPVYSDIGLSTVSKKATMLWVHDLVWIIKISLFIGKRKVLF